MQMEVQCFWNNWKSYSRPSQYLQSTKYLLFIAFLEKPFPLDNKEAQVVHLIVSQLKIQFRRQIIEHMCLVIILNKGLLRTIAEYLRFVTSFYNKK